MDPTPWYRQTWPWLLMLMPALAVVGGGVTLWLAITSDNPMVVDDYYREGKAINRQLARDEAAARLGLAGELVRLGDKGVELRLRSDGGALPPFVTVRLVHATRAELDRTVTLASAGGGTYRDAEAGLPASGHWHVQIEDPDRSWRLTGTTSGFGQPMRFDPRHE